MPRKRTRIISLAACGVLLLSGALHAQPEGSGLEPVQAPPPIPGLQSGNTLEPEVTITHSKKKVFQEYRINGRLYAVKIIPKDGAPYYFIDLDGDGTLETREYFLIPVNQWVLFSW
uniref:DUF2782 domain-containing protein n=1 Tax=Candidatus Kentrum sp. MB TaxID=2138164 RepID=A0A450XGH0_9GAMM|nr:MAG: Protein of unknown function (DUF2782) [Candidatus Kentron sp. MB]